MEIGRDGGGGNGSIVDPILCTVGVSYNCMVHRLLCRSFTG